MAKRSKPEPVKFETMGELIEAIRHHSGIVSTFLWLHNIEETTKQQSAGLWEEFVAEPVTEQSVKRLADALKQAINDEAQMWSLQRDYNRTLKKGHQLLRLLFSISQDHHLDLDLCDVDGPITFTEQMVDAGLVRLDGDKVVLTSHGKQIANAFRRSLINPAEDAQISCN